MIGIGAHSRIKTYRVLRTRVASSVKRTCDHSHSKWFGSLRSTCRSSDNDLGSVLNVHTRLRGGEVQCSVMMGQSKYPPTSLTSHQTLKTMNIPNKYACVPEYVADDWDQYLSILERICYWH